MENPKAIRARLFATGVVAVFAAFHILSEYWSGGVKSHHLLDRSDLPAISNWWGLVLLPSLAWFMVQRIQARGASVSSIGLARRTIWGFVGALLYGAGLAGAFALGFEAITSALFLGMFLLSALVPIYRAEFVLGFVLGMTLTFGAVLPTLVAGVFALISLLLHPVCWYLVRLARRGVIRWRGGPVVSNGS